MSPNLRPRSLRLSSDGILDRAEKLFCAKGYADVSLRQVIAAAEVSTTAFYDRFDSKEDVLAALSARFFAGLLNEAASALVGVRGLSEGVERGLAALVDALAPKKKLVRLLLVEAGASRAALAGRRDAYDQLVAFIAARLAGLKTPPAAPDAVAWALVGALELQIARWAVWGALDRRALEAALLAAAHAVLPRLAS